MEITTMAKLIKVANEKDLRAPQPWQQKLFQCNLNCAPNSANLRPALKRGGLSPRGGNARMPKILAMHQAGNRVAHVCFFHWPFSPNFPRIYYLSNDKYFHTQQNTH